MQASQRIELVEYKEYMIALFKEGNHGERDLG
jgi:hypothetical protein